MRYGRFTPSEVTVDVIERYDLLVRWTALGGADVFNTVRDSFRAALLPGARWSPADHAWRIPSSMRGALRRWLDRTFEEEAVEWTVRDGSDAGASSSEHAPSSGWSHAAMPPALVAAYQALHLQPTAPPQLVQAAYRCLAQLHHPDRGGETAAMAAVNEAISVIREHQEYQQRAHVA